jgi:UDP-hydrolysing UDP-N-acetyl-D-glucosamine 2-epimerase
MGEPPETVFQVGDPAIDVVANTSMDLNEDDIFSKHGVGPRIDLKSDYLLVVQHPVTTEYDDALKQINETLSAIYELKIPTIMLWPNPDAGSDGISKGIRVFREKYSPDFMHFFINLPVEDYIRLLYHAACAVGNSSSFIREGSFLGTPVVNIGTRQQGRERGKNVIDVGYNKDEIKRAIRKQMDHGKYKPEHIYGDGKSGKRIADILSKCEIRIQKRLAYPE